MLQLLLRPLLREPPPQEDPRGLCPACGELAVRSLFIDELCGIPGAVEHAVVDCERCDYHETLRGKRRCGDN